MLQVPTPPNSTGFNSSLLATGNTRSEFWIRAADITIASLVAIVGLPLILLLAAIVACTSKGPVLFVQQRLGRHGKPFPCLKFRTMVWDAEDRLQKLLASDPVARQIWERDRKLPSDPRITRIGRFLRLSSFDELPQLWNVLRGDMSLVGPRPIIASEVPKYRRYIVHYCSVRPGVTGLWQVSGRSGTTYRRRIALDVSFVRSYCIGQYFKILFKTVPAVLTSKGAC